VSDAGGGWDKWEGWVPGDPEPGSAPPPSRPSRRASESRPSGPTSNSPSATPAVVGLAALAVGAAVVVGFVGYAGVVVQDGVEVQVGTPTEITFVDDPDRGAPTVPTDEVPDGPADLVHVSAAPAFEILEAEVGPGVRATELLVYPEYLVATVEAADEPGELDRWIIYLGQAPIGPDPQRNVGDIADELFALDAVDLDLLASLPERAAAELGMGIEAVGYFILDRDVRGDGGLHYRVYASTERRNGYVRFASDGTVVLVSGG
jgi:hypothetical protein